MEYENLIQQEQDILTFLVDSGKITAENLPKGIWVGLDSMGPARDPKTDVLFPGMKKVFHGFTQTMTDYDLGLVVATNGPAKEGKDILNALDSRLKPKAFADTEGGGLIVKRTLEEEIIASEKEIDLLRKVEAHLYEDGLMKAMLEDEGGSDSAPPIRTPYKTNIVLTMPASYEAFLSKMESRKVDVTAYIPGIDKANYVERVLNYAKAMFRDAINSLGLSDSIGPEIIKLSNRRVYLPVQHIGTQLALNKYNGALTGASSMGMPEFDLDRAIYVADTIIDVTRDEGNRVLGASEESMVKNGQKTVRMAFNVTMDGALPTIEHVTGVKILNIGSGAKALEAIDFLYRKLHSGYEPVAPQKIAA